MKFKTTNTSKASETKSGIRDLSPDNQAIVSGLINTIS